MTAEASWLPSATASLVALVARCLSDSQYRVRRPVLAETSSWRQAIRMTLDLVIDTIESGEDPHLVVLPARLPELGPIALGAGGKYGRAATWATSLFRT